MIWGANNDSGCEMMISGPSAGHSIMQTKYPVEIPMLLMGFFLSNLFTCSVMPDIVEAVTHRQPSSDEPLFSSVHTIHHPFKIRFRGCSQSSSPIKTPMSLSSLHRVPSSPPPAYLPPFPTLNFGNTNGTLNLATRLVAPSARLNPRSSQSFFPIFPTLHPSSLK